MGNGPFYRYCADCGMRLGSSDFLSGRACRIGHVIRCLACVKRELEPQDPPEAGNRRPDTRRSLTST